MCRGRTADLVAASPSSDARGLSAAATCDRAADRLMVASSARSLCRDAPRVVCLRTVRSIAARGNINLCFARTKGRVLFDAASPLPSVKSLACPLSECGWAGDPAWCWYRLTTGASSSCGSTTVSGLATLCSGEARGYAAGRPLRLSRGLPSPASVPDGHP